MKEEDVAVTINLLVKFLEGISASTEECSGILWNDLIDASSIAVPLVDCRP
jgi:hypothetical protein